MHVGISPRRQSLQPIGWTRKRGRKREGENEGEGGSAPVVEITVLCVTPCTASHWSMSGVWSRQNCSTGCPSISRLEHLSSPSVICYVSSVSSNLWLTYSILALATVRVIVLLLLYSVFQYEVTLTHKSSMTLIDMYRYARTMVLFF